jgi:hypothetical protein
MTGAISPADLPARLRQSIGWRNAENLDRIADRPFGHIQPGTYVRNWMRGQTAGWTDQELDCQWRAVLRRAAKQAAPPR